MSKLYKRDGRRFIEVPDCTGMYYNKDGTFSKECTPNSIAKCVLQTPTYRLVHALDLIPDINWYDAKEKCKAFLDCGYLPSRLELCYVGRKYSNVYIWSSDEYNSSYVWRWCWLSSTSFANFHIRNKRLVSQYYCALPFAKLPI